MGTTVGGTMVSRILGASRWGGPLSAYFELTGHAPPEPEKVHQSRGTALEESVLAMLCERMGGSVVRAGAVKAPAMPYAHASLDAVWTGLPSPDVITDAKTLAREAMCEDWGPDGTDLIPLEYHFQLLWYLGVCKATGMQVADEALLPTLVGPEAELQWAARLVKAAGRPLVLADIEGSGLELRVYQVAWDADLFEEMNARVLGFLREHVEPRIPPEPSPGEVLARDARAVSSAYKADPGRVLDYFRLPPEHRAVLDELLAATKERRACEKEEERAALRVKLVMGTAEMVVMPSGERVTWSERKDGVRVFKVSEPKGRK